MIESGEAFRTSCGSQAGARSGPAGRRGRAGGLRQPRGGPVCWPRPPPTASWPALLLFITGLTASWPALLLLVTGFDSNGALPHAVPTATGRARCCQKGPLTATGRVTMLTLPRRRPPVARRRRAGAGAGRTFASARRLALQDPESPDSLSGMIAERFRRCRRRRDSNRGGSRCSRGRRVTRDHDRGGFPASGGENFRSGELSVRGRQVRCSGLWREFRDQSPIMTQDRHCQGPWVNVRDNGGEHDHGASPLSGRLSGGSGCCKVKLWRPGGETLPRFPETSRFPECYRLWRGVFPALARSLVVARSVLRT